jgi:FSR family fosmidomycin resistance protein-like MFS transporter
LRLRWPVQGRAPSTHLASAAVSGAYGRAARRPLGIYNFTGDLGKAAIPALMSLLLVSVAWQQAVFALAAAGIAVSVAMALWMPAVGTGHFADPKVNYPVRAGESRGGFSWLLAIGMLDSAVRMGFLTFLPFLLIEKGRDVAHQRFRFGTSLHRRSRGQIRLRLAGRQDRHQAHRVSSPKFHGLSDPWRAGATACPGDRAPAGARGDAQRYVVGAVWNGPRTDPSDRTARAFALFYTGTIGAGAGAPILYGFLGDAFGPGTATAATAMTALAICPFMIALSTSQRGHHRSDCADVETRDIAHGAVSSRAPALVVFSVIGIPPIT